MEAREEAQTMQWVRAACGGDRAAFGRLFEHVAPDLYTWAELRIRPHYRAYVEPTDIVQEVWFRAFRAIERYDPDRAPFRYWIFRVAKNVLLESSRQLERIDRANGLGPSTRRFALENVPDEATAISRRLERDEDLGKFIEQVRRLDQEEQRIFVHCGLEGMQHAEVAERMGLSHAAVTKRWQRLRQRLRAG